MSYAGFTSRCSAFHWLIALGSLSATVTCVAQSPTAVVRVRQAADLRVSPDGVSKVIAKVATQTQLSLLPGRFGPWVQVRTANGVVGWLLLLDIMGTRPVAPSLQAAPAPYPLSLAAPSPGVPTPIAPALAALPAPAAVAGQMQPAATGGTSLTTPSPQSPSITVSAAVPVPPAAPTIAMSTTQALAEQRLQTVEAYRQDSEAARRFAFHASLDLIKLPPTLTSTPASLAVADGTAPTDAARGANLGKDRALAILGKNALVQDISLQTYVNELGRWLSLESSQPDLAWTFGVLDNTEPLAYAAPGGYIFLTQGLLDKLSNEAGLASVLAIQIALVTGTPSQNAQPIRGNPGLPEPGLSGQIAADQAAALLLTRTGFNPFALVNTIKLMSPGGEENTLFSALIGTDAATKERLAALKRFMGSRFDAYANQTSVSVAQRLAQINTPRASTPSTP